MEDDITKYTSKEITDELSHLEKQITSEGPFKMDERTKEVVGYYLTHLGKYKDALMINGHLDEVSYELLLRHINSKD